MALKQIKVNEEIKETLDSIKYYENETYSSIIARLIEDNKQLREDKKQLFQIFINRDELTLEGSNFNKVYGFLLSLDNIESKEEVQLQVMEIYLSELIKTDPTSVLDAIQVLKETTVNEDSISILDKFEKYVKASV